MLLYHVCFMLRRNFLESNVTNGLYEKNKQNSSFQFQPQAIVVKVSLQVCNAVTWEHQQEAGCGASEIFRMGVHLCLVYPDTWPV